MLNLFILSIEAEARTRGVTLTDAQRDRLRTLFAANADLVWRLLRRQGLTKAQADDGLQQVFVVALDRMPELEVGKERSFLCATAVQAARRLGEWREDLPGQLPDMESPERLDEQLESQRQRLLISKLLASMEEDLRLVLVLHDIEGLSKRETAEALGIPEGTVASRTRRAREVFRQLLSSHVGRSE